MKTRIKKVSKAFKPMGYSLSLFMAFFLFVGTAQAKYQSGACFHANASYDLAVNKQPILEWVAEDEGDEEPDVMIMIGGVAATDMETPEVMTQNGQIALTNVKATGIIKKPRRQSVLGGVGPSNVCEMPGTWNFQIVNRASMLNSEQTWTAVMPKGYISKVTVNMTCYVTWVKPKAPMRFAKGGAATDVKCGEVDVQALGDGV